MSSVLDKATLGTIIESLHLIKRINVRFEETVYNYFSIHVIYFTCLAELYYEKHKEYI